MATESARAKLRGDCRLGRWKKFEDIFWIWELFGSVISFGLEQIATPLTL
jgi:hypothetical protein